MPSHNYPKDIFEQFDIELCELENLVKGMQNAKSGYFPTYEKAHLPHDLFNGQAFHVEEGQFCVYVDGWLYCMPTPVPLPAIPYDFMTIGTEDVGAYWVTTPTFLLPGGNQVTLDVNVGFGTLLHGWFNSNRTKYYYERAYTHYQTSGLPIYTLAKINMDPFNPTDSATAIGVISFPDDLYMVGVKATGQTSVDDFVMSCIVVDVSNYFTNPVWPDTTTPTPIVPAQLRVYDPISGSHSIVDEEDTWVYPLSGGGPSSLDNNGSPFSLRSNWSSDGEAFLYVKYTRTFDPTTHLPFFGPPEEWFMYGGGAVDVTDYSSEIKWNPTNHEFFYRFAHYSSGSTPTLINFGLKSSESGVIYSETPDSTFIPKLADWRVSPDGTNIAMIIDHVLHLLDGGIVHPKVYSGTVSCVWSPDGTMIGVMETIYIRTTGSGESAQNQYQLNFWVTVINETTIPQHAGTWFYVQLASIPGPAIGMHQWAPEFNV